MTIARTREALRPAQRRVATRARASQRRVAAQVRAVWRRVAALIVTVVGVATVYTGVSGWSQDLALVFVGVTMMVYGLLFIDLDGPRRRGRG